MPYVCASSDYFSREMGDEHLARMPRRAEMKMFDHYIEMKPRQEDVKSLSHHAA